MRSGLPYLGRIQNLICTTPLFRAGQALVLHANAEKRDKWEAMKETNPVLRQFVSAKKAWEESENPVISSIRGVTDSVSSFLFDETENAQVTRMLRAMDPSYDPETFQRELREYIIPEVIDAYLSADQQALRLWCGEAVGVFSELKTLPHLTACVLPYRPIMSSGPLSKPTSSRA